MARDTDETSERPAGGPNPVWFKPIMVGFMLLGLVWIIVFYLSGNQYPIPDIGAWNLLIGFGIAFIGFLMTTRWR
ncbi:cell division protein CrgA [Microbacterium halophytorum]|uniref:cell division protein CrgA n=1 Tax=Microbacterium halophytorum TaxID=2067568 RepID=UPI000CFD2440|nr:cell division protein CrgA [Microbacterium halophytorum]